MPLRVFNPLEPKSSHCTHSLLPPTLPPHPLTAAAPSARRRRRPVPMLVAPAAPVLVVVLMEGGRHRRRPYGPPLLRPSAGAGDTDAAPVLRLSSSPSVGAPLTDAAPVPRLSSAPCARRSQPAYRAPRLLRARAV